VTLRIDVVTIFPELFPGPLGASIPGRALERGLAELHAHDLREWGLGRHRSVDDYPYGGGAGMIMRPEPVAAALKKLAGPNTIKILLDPGGVTFRQTTALELAAAEHLLFIAPRYEGVDHRIRGMVDLELSIGDYVLSGGELPAMVVIDAVLRLLPGAIEPDSVADESFSDGLLEYPQYTRPAEFEGESVPDVLLSGNHGEVEKWRRQKALERTRNQRADLLSDRED
jgi:tRNA (guanine37-N1)-methyltransferase